MAEDFGSGVSRTLSALQRQFQTVIWQAGKPPLDSELNLMSQMDADRMARLVRSSMPSGFLLDPTISKRDFRTSSTWSNFFKLGLVESADTSTGLWANVNGWIIPVAGTSTTEGDLSNRLDLFPPPTSDARIDFVFLEVWQGQVAPNPSTDNKPAADKVWKYGNVKYGGVNPVDDLEDPAIGFETTERVQIQYRLRVFGSGSGLGTSVALNNFPDGLDDPNVVAQGSATSPIAGFTFMNMLNAGDPGLWRAGDGDATNDLGTVDGYVYAIPVCAIFRRNSSSFVARTTSGNANQNGALTRNPTSLSFTDPAEGTTILGTATLTNAIDEADTGIIQVEGLVGSGLENTDINWNSTFLVLDDEIISISSVDTSTSPGTITIRASGGRGRWGSMAVPHAVGVSVRFFNWRHDGLFADQITDTDILDMRRSVNLGDWDYQRILQSNLSKLLQGTLRSSYKQAGIGDTQGPYVVEVDTIDARGTVLQPNQTEALDGPDGIRTIFSDAATLQPDVTMLLNDPNTLATGSPGFVANYTSGVIWSVGADFIPGGFVVGGDGWRNGDVVFVHLGGSDGTGGARATFRDGSERAVRLVGPQDYWHSTEAAAERGRQTPVTLRFLSEGATDPAGPGETAASHPGPVYPLKTSQFERPFIVLGGILNSDSQVAAGATVVPESGPAVEDWEVELTGLDFDTPGDWFSKTGPTFNNDPDLITKPVLNGSRTLYSMLTRGGRDRTGASSEIYLVLWGDDTIAPTTNNGVFRVVGAGTTAGYTTRDATAADRVRIEFISDGVLDFTAASGLNAEFRSQYTHSEDGGGSSSGIAAAAIVLTDIEGVEGGSTNPWNSLMAQPITSKLEVHMTLQYHPGRGGTARVADEIHRVAVVTAGSEYLRRNPTSQDTTFPASAGVPDDETYFDLNHIQTWNRLSGLGLDAPSAPAYGGEIVSFTEQDREAECFLDSGSKTVMLRPYLVQAMTLVSRTATAALIPPTYIATHDVDGANIFEATHKLGYALPPEFMPRFGRQDIPFFVDVAGTGAGTFLQGINHMFVDTLDETDPQFNVIGGTDQGGGGGVASILLQSTSTITSGLAYGEYGAIPPGSLGSAFQCRIYTDNTVVSSDLGRGLKGIQLPAFYGIARIYGIFERTDFENAGGGTMFDTDRITPIAGSAPNLLRTDADKQTLFIVQNGADDVITGTGSHTYVIPFDAIDVELSDSFTTGTEEDYEYIVECVVFGFARGFIDENTYVLARLFNGSGGSADAELDGAGMVFPSPAPLNDEFYIAYNRTPYQGDPYMTRAGSSRVVSDYEHRYGQIPQASAVELANAIQQFDSNGDTLIETPNARALQVLASLDFYTTLGTGNIGGALFSGTVTDVGHTVNNVEAASRVPNVGTDPPWQMAVRAFSESQKGNPSKARATVYLVDNGAVAGKSLTITGPTGIVTFTAGVEFAVGGTVLVTTDNIITAINANSDITGVVKAEPWDGTTSNIRLTAILSGAAGNDITVGTSDTDIFKIIVGEPEALDGIGVITTANLQGGIDRPVNSGDGRSSLDLTGLTERLPLGILVQDSDFIAEDLLRDNAGQLVSFAGGMNALVAATPLTDGEEYTRFLGGAGGFLGMADGSILIYAAFDETTQPSGTKSFRLFRGGGSAYVLSPPRPGGPVDWVAGHIPASFQPVLKGAVLACKALLVRNFPETAFSGGERTSYGDEIQMVIVTRTVFGKGNETNDGITLSGLISPTGYGEGYAASDRYRLEGYPMVADHGSVGPDTDVELAIYPFDDLTPNTDC